MHIHILIYVPFTDLLSSTGNIYQNKPYAMRTTASSSSSSSRSLPLSLEPWNYNVSHHGIYVCVASHPTLMVSCSTVLCGAIAAVCCALNFQVLSVI